MDEPDPWAGTLLAGRYRVLRRIGRGGMGLVYEGLQEDIGRAVAIKILREDLVEDRDAIVRFRREAEAAARLGHPNIVQVSDFQWRQGEPAFLVMELLSGVSLAALLRERQFLEPQEVVRIAIQVLDALAAAHAAGIVHRDIKPDNVFLTQIAGIEGSVTKLLDFGVAKLLGADVGTTLTVQGAMVGTPAYMAPEQIAGEDIDARADLYSLGVVMYRALAGRPPFAGGVPELVHAILSRVPPTLRSIRPDLDTALVQIVERAMAKSRSWRFSSAAEMRTALEQWLAGSHAQLPAHPPRVAPAPVAIEPTRQGTPAQAAQVAPPRRSRAGRTVAVAAVASIALASLGALGIAGRDALQCAGDTAPPRRSIAGPVALVSPIARADAALLAPPPANDEPFDAGAVVTAQARRRPVAPRPPQLASQPAPQQPAPQAETRPRARVSWVDLSALQPDDEQWARASRAGIEASARPVAACLARAGWRSRDATLRWAHTGWARSSSWLMTIASDGSVSNVRRGQTSTAGPPPDERIDRCVEPELTRVALSAPPSSTPNAALVIVEAKDGEP